MDNVEFSSGRKTVIDVGEKELKNIRELLKKYLPDTLVWAYGSRVKFTATKISDLDLVAFITEVQQGNLSDLQEAFDESNLPFRVDVLNWNKIPDKFKENIQKEYVVVQEVENNDQKN